MIITDEMKKFPPLGRVYVILTSEKLKPASTFGCLEDMYRVIEKLGLYCIVTRTLDGFVCDATYDKAIYEGFKEMRRPGDSKMNPKEWTLTCDHAEFGRIYGYPICCTDAYTIDMKNVTSPGRRFNKQLLELGRVPQELYYLIHIPCSPKCKESLDLARTYRTILERRDPEALMVLEDSNKQ